MWYKGIINLDFTDSCSDRNWNSICGSGYKPQMLSAGMLISWTDLIFSQFTFPYSTIATEVIIKALQDMSLTCISSGDLLVILVCKNFNTWQAKNDFFLHITVWLCIWKIYASIFQVHADKIRRYKSGCDDATGIMSLQYMAAICLIPCMKLTGNKLVLVVSGCTCQQGNTHVSYPS